MATQSNSPFRCEVADTVYVYRLVKNSATGAVVNTATSTDVPIGTVQPSIDGGYADGDTISVRGIGHGTSIVVAAGVIARGADIYAAAAGKVQALPGGAGTYRRVGSAYEAASGDGSQIEAILDCAGTTETVSGS